MLIYNLTFSIPGFDYGLMLNIPENTESAGLMLIAGLIAPFFAAVSSILFPLYCYTKYIIRVNRNKKKMLNSS